MELGVDLWCCYVLCLYFCGVEYDLDFVFYVVWLLNVGYVWNWDELFGDGIIDELVEFFECYVGCFCWEIGNWVIVDIDMVDLWFEDIVG